MIRIILLLCLTILPVYADSRLDAGVSLDYNMTFEQFATVKKNLPKIERNFIDLQYSINYKPLNLIGEGDFNNFNGKKPSKIKVSNYISPSSYNISFSTGKLQTMGESADKLFSMIQENPNNKDLLFAYAIQLKNEGNLNEALEIAEKAVNIDPDYALAHFLKGDILRKLKRFKEACYQYIYTTQINPYCADAYYNIAKILELFEDRELALDYYKIAYQINPADEEIRRIIIEDYKDL